MKKAIDVLQKIQTLVGSIFLTIFLVTVVIQMLTRYLGISAIWTEDVAMYSFIWSIFMGASIMVAQYFGAKQREELSYTIGNCIVLTGIASLIIMVLSVIITRPLLDVLKTPPSIIDWCEDYLMILFLGCAGSAFYNILSGIFSSLNITQWACIAPRFCLSRTYKYSRS